MHSDFRQTVLWKVSRVLAALGFASIFAVPLAHAHVRWFVDANDPALETFPTYSWNDPAVLSWIAIGCLLICTAVVLDGRFPRVPIIPSKLRHDAIELLRIFTGMSFLLTAYTGALIAPHMEAFNGFGYALVFLEAVIGIMLISNNLVHHAAILMVLLYLGTMVNFGFVKAFEYVNIIGIALFLYFNYVPNEELRAKLKPYSVDMLCIFTGVALVTLGITEKLTGAMLGQAFIANYQWNFMPALGFDWYTDQLFVLSAGAMEVVFGTILILGVVTRLNILVVAVFMLASNITFLVFGQNDHALMELVGHMPIIATAVILLLLGYGQKIKLKNPTLRSQNVKTAPAE